MNAPETNLATQLTIAMPDLNPGERLVATVITPNGRRDHVIRMAQEVQTSDELTWKAAMKFAEDAGGELPDRVEGALLYATKEEGEFEPDWYWTREQDAGDESCAWLQSFSHGRQDNDHKGYQYRVVLVRRVAIQPFTNSESVCDEK
ncbi:MAG: hypothetical protein WC100_00765 [Sterolibacterium sp.]